MNLVNHTPLPACAIVTHSPDPARRLGMVVAKATFRIEGREAPRLDREHPHPLYDEDRPTELGLLPEDLLPRHGPELEVILLGAAYNRPARPAASRGIALTVGSVTRHMVVHGDRKWEGSVAGWTIGPAAPFEKMPLVWERAFGGRCDVWIDRDAKAEVIDPLNARGRGFDPSAQATVLAKVLRAPGGFPHVQDAGLLPNLEDPATPIVRRSDTPEPCCWATVPRDIGFFAIDTIRRQRRGLSPQGDIHSERERLALRAHPDWIIELPAPGAPVHMQGFSVDETIAFMLPRLRVLVDYAVGDRSGRLELRPQRLVLLPEERRLYIVYRALFTVDRPTRGERSMRLRIADGWFVPGQGAIA